MPAQSEESGYLECRKPRLLHRNAASSLAPTARALSADYATSLSNGAQQKMAKLDQPVPGLYFDELSKIRVFESESSTQTNELKEECQEFVESKHGHHN